MLSDEVYAAVKRGTTVEAVAGATQLLRQHALKVHYHWMPGLPGSLARRRLAPFGLDL